MAKMIKVTLNNGKVIEGNGAIFDNDKIIIEIVVSREKISHVEVASYTASLAGLGKHMTVMSALTHAHAHGHAHLHHHVDAQTLHLLSPFRICWAQL